MMIYSDSHDESLQCKGHFEDMFKQV